MGHSSTPSDRRRRRAAGARCLGVGAARASCSSRRAPQAERDEAAEREGPPLERVGQVRPGVGARRGQGAGDRARRTASSAVIAPYASIRSSPSTPPAAQDLLGGDRLDLPGGRVAVRRRLVVPQPRGERHRARPGAAGGVTSTLPSDPAGPSPGRRRARSPPASARRRSRRTRPRRRTAPARGTPGCRRPAGCAAGRCRRARSARRRSRAATRRRPASGASGVGRTVVERHRVGRPVGLHDGDRAVAPHVPVPLPAAQERADDGQDDADEDQHRVARRAAGLMTRGADSSVRRGDHARAGSRARRGTGSGAHGARRTRARPCGGPGVCSFGLFQSRPHVAFARQPRLLQMSSSTASGTGPNRLTCRPSGLGRGRTPDRARGGRRCPDRSRAPS